MSRPLTGFRLEIRFGNREFSIGTMVRTTKIEPEEPAKEPADEVHQVGSTRSVQAVPEPPRPAGFSPQIDT
jgi:hypothetical protein